MAHSIGELAYISGLLVTYPLRQGLIETQGLQFVSGKPGELDRRMAEGSLAAGPISSLEYLKRPERYRRVEDLAISSWGRFGSAVLFSRVPFGKLSGQSIALPSGGATSNVLIQWLLARMFGVEAIYDVADGPLAELLTRHAAVLLIGDQAILEGRVESACLQLDLGEAWWQLQHTPLVQTIWVCQRSLPEGEQEKLIALFQQAKKIGMSHLPAIFSEAEQRLGLPVKEIEAYFALLNYDFAPVHEQSVILLGELLTELAPLG
jgi:chorismate dehydratase